MLIFNDKSSWLKEKVREWLNSWGNSWEALLILHSLHFVPQEGHLHHPRSSWGPHQIGICGSVCVFAWVSVSMHAWAILSGGDCKRQGSQSEGPGLSQLISRGARPQTGQQQQHQPGQQSSCETAGGENVSLTLQIELFKELIWGCLASPYLIWPQLIRLLLH